MDHVAVKNAFEMMFSEERLYAVKRKNFIRVPAVLTDLGFEDVDGHNGEETILWSAGFHTFTWNLVRRDDAAAFVVDGGDGYFIRVRGDTLAAIRKVYNELVLDGILPDRKRK